MTWLNEDGLLVKFGTELGVTAQGGSYNVLGDVQKTRLIIGDMTDLTTTPTILEGWDKIFLPSGARINKVTYTAETACTSGGSATLDIGLKRKEDRSTEIDHDGLIAAAALATMDASGDVVELVQGSTGHGALVGTTLATYDGVFVVSYGTAAFTAGKLFIDVEWYMTA